jgi:ADP-ribose pyrophosphatase YjhB (NUDIX family)
MKPIKVLRDSDVGSNTPDPSEYVVRKAARALVFDRQGRVALLHARNKGYHKQPGGGIEEGEDVLQALKRECIEEIGCNIENVQELGVIEEFRNNFKFHQFSYCYTADLLGEQGQNQLEEDELADGFVPVWMSLEDAIKTLESETEITNYDGKFIRMRDLFLLKEVKR